MTDLARALVDFMASVFGHVRGGLGYVLLGAMYLISGISGSKAADMAAVVPILFPKMKRRGNEPSELIALLAASGAMSETIPPSIVLITIGSVSGTTIAALFTGGLMPALVAGAAIGVLTWFRSRRDKPVDIVRPSLRAIGPQLYRGAAGTGAAGADPLRGSGWRCHRDGSLHRRHRLYRASGNCVALHPRDGDRVVRAALWCRLPLRMRHRWRVA